MSSGENGGMSEGVARGRKKNGCNLSIRPNKREERKEKALLLFYYAQFELTNQIALHTVHGTWMGEHLK